MTPVPGPVLETSYLRFARASAIDSRRRSAYLGLHMNASRTIAVLGFAAALVTAASASAGTLGGNDGVGGYSPRVPVSALARPMVGFDPSRLHFSTTLSVGTGFGGRSEGLQVSRLSYNFGAPLSMSVSLGNAFGSNMSRGGNAFFLEGLDVAWRPTASTVFQIRYQDLRSPLQYRDYGFSGIDRSYFAR